MRLGTGLWPTAWLVASAAAAQAGETVTYSYDSLGRLTGVSRTGAATGPSTAGYSYDPADNRSNVTVVAPAPAPLSSPAPSLSLSTSLSASPSPSPSAGNRPPVAVDDNAAIRICDRVGSFLPLANDHDPDGDAPIVLLEVSYSGGLGNAVADEQRILFMPTGLGTGTASIAYRIRDAEGASAIGRLTLDVAQGPCR